MTSRAFTASETLELMVQLGKQRAEKSSIIWDTSGETPRDSFDDTDQGITVWNPWISTCGRFEVDPFKEYGQPFVEWLMRPFYPEWER